MGLHGTVRGCRWTLLLGTAWHCAGLSLDLAAWVFHGTACAHVFGVALAGRFAAPCFHDFCSVDVFTIFATSAICIALSKLLFIQHA